MEPFGSPPDMCVLGTRTLVYGRNGSGKTTISEALRLTAADQLAGPTVLNLIAVDNGSEAMIRLSANTGPRIFVFNRHYIEDELRGFLDGDDKSPPIVVKLGKENIQAEEDLQDTLKSIEVLTVRHDIIRRRDRELENEIDSLERKIKDAIISALSPGDAGKYNPQSFNVTRVRQVLKRGALTQLDSKALASKIAIANAPDSAVVIAPSTDWPIVAIDRLQTTFDSLLTREVVSTVLPELSEHADVSEWVEQGVSLHQEGDTCRFCQTGTITAELLTKYHEHFSTSLSELRVDLVTEKQRILSEVDNIKTWLEAAPTPRLLQPDYQASYTSELATVQEESKKLIGALDSLVALLDTRLADPLSPLVQSQRPTDEAPQVAVAKLLNLINKSNGTIATARQSREQARTAVESHFAAIESKDIDRLQGKRLKLVPRAIKTIDDRAARLERQASDLRAVQEDTASMASAIDSDICAHYGHSHLRVRPSADGKGYVVTRDGEPARMLSEGERNALAFTYFLRTLEADGVKPNESLVVIDDPVSSLDRDAIFSVFALAKERTKNFAQVVFLTHDYEYFRLLLRDHAKQYGKSKGLIANGDGNEARTPSVSVLEAVTREPGGDSSRLCEVKEMPASLVNHPSEYFYLFHKVANAVLGPDPTELPLLGNVNRRLIEGFLAFRAPNITDFQGQIDAVVRDSSIDPVLAERVVKFLHSQSHRNEPRAEAAIDLQGIENQLAAALAFMRVVDEAHFLGMCKALSIETSSLVSRLPTVPMVSAAPATLPA